MTFKFQEQNAVNTKYWDSFSIDNNLHHKCFSHVACLQGSAYCYSQASCCNVWCALMQSSNLSRGARMPHITPSGSLLFLRPHMQLCSCFCSDAFQGLGTVRFLWEKQERLLGRWPDCIGICLMQHPVSWGGMQKECSDILFNACRLLKIWPLPVSFCGCSLSG